MELSVHENTNMELEENIKRNEIIHETSIDPKNETQMFSRYLYKMSDVKISFINALLNKNYQESLWWFFEYYYSLNNECDKAWQMLFEIYYDYFAIHYPKMESYIMKRYKLWKYGEEIADFGGDMDSWNFVDDDKHDIWWAICVIKNLCLRKICGFDLFVLRQTMENVEHFKIKTYRFSKTGDRVKEDRQWLYSYNYDRNLYPLLWAMHERDWSTICYWIKKYEDKDVELYENVLHYLVNVEKYPLNIDMGVRKWKNYRCLYKNRAHMILGIIAYCFKYSLDDVDNGTHSNFAEMVEKFNNINVNTVINSDEGSGEGDAMNEEPEKIVNFEGLVLEMIYITPPTSDKVMVSEWSKIHEPLWKILTNKRLYKISNMNNCFNSCCEEMMKSLNDLRHNWTAKCFHCPFWNRTFKRVGAVYIDGKVVFPNEDKEELWIEGYNLEPDEQSYDTQIKSIIGDDAGMKITWKSWFYRKERNHYNDLLFMPELSEDFTFNLY